MNCDLKQLVFAFLLKFGRIDLEDIMVLKKMYFSNDCSTECSASLFDNDLNKWLFNLAGDEALGIIKEMDLEVFIMEKLKILGRVPEENLRFYFNTDELNRLDEMVSKKYIAYSWNSDASNDNYRYLRLLQNGEIYLFRKNNEKLMYKFLQELDDNGYINDEDSVLEFLSLQNLSEEASHILTIEKFEEFGYLYDLNIEKDVRSLVKRKDGVRGLLVGNGNSFK